MTRTILTIAEQNQFLSDNWQAKNISHKWSSRGMGNSKILDAQGNVIGKAGGCGYDRYGAALGEAIITLFPKELFKLAKRECKGKRRNYKQAKKFYGMFYSSITGMAWLDGGCGSNCMEKILNKIGFSIERVGEHEGSNNGEVFYTLKPVTKHDKQFL